MHQPASSTTCIPLIATALLLLACDAKPEAPAAETPSSAVATSADRSVGVLATVNGATITEDDVALKIKSRQNAPLTPERKKAIVETLIREELLRQAAIERGLHEQEDYAAARRAMGARLIDFERSKLSQLYFRKEIAGRAAATDAEVRDYFAANESRIQSELHVMQILSRDKAEIEKALAEIENGKPFEDVARARFETLPPGRPPWDLGFLKWKQVPEPWRAHVYDLEPGQTSKVISGPRRRFWIVKLVARRIDESLNLETVGPMLREELQSSTIESARKAAIDGLRQAARIEYFGPR